MRLDLDDGYTLTAETESAVIDKATGLVQFSGLPVVRFKYRPALPDALFEFRYKYARAASGKEQLDILSVFVAGHLVEWDVTHKGATADINLATVRRIPEPILTQMEAAVAKWAPRAEQDRGN